MAFEYTGGPQSFVVPAGVTRVAIAAAGAEGGTGGTSWDITVSSFANGSPGGLGGTAATTLDISYTAG
ncbi:MAG: hypothetical protein ACT4PI_10880 [Actinomycetota bacterium]